MHDKSLQSCLTLLRPYGLQPTRFLCPWNFPGKNTGVGCYSPPRGIFPTQGLNHILCVSCIAGGFFTTESRKPYIYRHTHTHTHTQADTQITHTHIHIDQTHTQTDTDTYTYTQRHIHMYTQIHIYTHTDTHRHIHTQIHRHTCRPTHAYTHTDTHTHRHTMTKANPTVSGLGVKFNTRVKEVVNMTR